MRTTISLDDRLGAQLKARAAAEGLSVSAFVARIIDDALKRGPEEPDDEPPLELITVSGPPADGVDLDRTGDLLAAEDEQSYRAR